MTEIKFFVDGIWIDGDELAEYLETRSKDNLVITKTEGWINNWEPSIEDALEAVEQDEYIDALSFDRDAFIAFLNEDNYYTVNDFEDAYVGSFDDVESFAKNETDGLYDVPGFIEMYIDYEKMGDDFLMSDYFESNGYYFRNV